jgi:hypothetical protein
VPPPSDEDRPVAVWIVGPDRLPDGLLEPILWGLEEEGIPADIRPTAAGTVTELAKRAADDSPLNVGIAVSDTDRAVVLHHRDLAAPRPLFVLGAPELEPALLRRLGANAARLVKGNPLAVEDEPVAVAEAPAPRAAPPEAPAPRSAPASSTAPGQPAARTEVTADSADLVNRIAALVVARLLAERGWRPQPSSSAPVARRTA